MHYFNFLHVPASEALLGFLQEGICPTLPLKRQLCSHTDPSHPDSRTARSRQHICRLVCAVAFFFFLHLLGLHAHMKSDMWMNLCISGCGESIYAYMAKKERLHSMRVSHRQVWKHGTFCINELMKS